MIVYIAGIASPESAVSGTQITLTATPDPNYSFKEWQVISGSIIIANNSFTMPDEDVEVKAVFESIPSGGGANPGAGGGGSVPSTPSESDPGPSIYDVAISEIIAAEPGTI